MRITSFQESDTAGITALKFIVDDRQMCGYSWEQACVKLQADSIYFLIGHSVLIVSHVVYEATKTLQSMHRHAISSAIKTHLKFY